MSDIPPSTTRHWKTPLAITLLIALFGTAVTHVSLSNLLVVNNIWFSTLFVALALLLVGPLSAVIVGFLVIGYAAFSTGHVDYLYLHLGEAIFLAAASPRRGLRWDLILVDLIYWVAIAGPIYVGLCMLWFDLSLSTPVVISLVYALTGVTNVVIANVLLLVANPILRRFTTLPRRAVVWRLPVYTRTLLSAFTFAPVIVALIMLSRWDRAGSLDSMHHQAIVQANHISEDIRTEITQLSINGLRLLDKMPVAKGEISNIELPVGVIGYFLLNPMGLSISSKINESGDYTSNELFNDIVVASVNANPLTFNAGLRIRRIGDMVYSFAPSEFGKNTQLFVWDVQKLVDSLSHSGQPQVVGGSNWVFSSNDDRDALLAEHFQPSNIADILLPKQTELPDFLRNMEARVFAVSPIDPVTGTGVISVLPIRGAIEGIHAKYTVILTVVGVILILVVFGSRLVIRHVSRISSYVQSHAQAIFDGKKADDTFLKTSNLLELRLLADWFNAVEAALQEKTVEQQHIVKDIRKLHLIRNAQQKLVDDLTRLIDTANAPIFGIDTDGNVTEWNVAMERVTGWDKAEVIGRNLLEKITVDEVRLRAGAFLNKALNGEEQQNVEMPIFPKGGDRVDLLLSSTTRRDDTGAIIGVFCVGQDITEIKQSHEKVVHASKLATLGEMATGVAHELNQPLNIMRLAVGNCLVRLDKGEVKTDYLVSKLKRIEEQITRSASIIDHMRVFGRKPNGEGTEISPIRCLRNTEDFIGEQLRLAGIDVKVAVAQNDGALSFGDTIQVEQVFLNILTNARDAIQANAPEDRSIRIWQKVDEKFIHIFVQDAAGGIPEDKLDRIFEPFFTTKDVGEGTGLGLSISYGIMRDLGGKIEAVNIDGGARFKVSFPIVEPRQETTQEQ